MYKSMPVNSNCAQMHVLFIPTNYPTTYQPTKGIFFKDQAEALAAAGLNVGVLAIAHLPWGVFKAKRIDIGLQTYRENNVNVFRFQTPAIPRNKYLYSDLKTIIGKLVFKKYVNKFGFPDLIHAHVFLAGGLAMWIKKKYNIPFMITEHYSYFQDGTLRAWEDRLAKRIFHESILNIAVSPSTASYLQNRYACQMHYLPNMVDTDFFKPEERQNTKKLTFVSLGSLDSNKNHEMMISAFKQAMSELKVNDYELKIIGEGHLRKHLSRLIYENGLKNKVKLLGRLSRDEVRRVFNTADYYVHSSLVETFCISMIEAMSCGLPVLTTRCGGPESIIIDDDLGVLCDKDKNSLADGLKKILSYQFDRKKIRQYIINKFSKEVIAQLLLKEYQNVLDRI